MAADAVHELGCPLWIHDGEKGLECTCRPTKEAIAKMVLADRERDAERLKDMDCR